MKNKKRIRHLRRLDYCGKTYGFLQYTIGFILGAALGVFTAEIMYREEVFKLILGLAFGAMGAKAYVSYLYSRRKREFREQFCDYLDSVSSSLACGKNTYEAFVTADEDICELYKRESPICVESRRLADGLKSGRGIDELLMDMAIRTDNEDVRIFSEVYGVCNAMGANLRAIVGETKQTVSEKVLIEAEIRAALTEPKNELNIMSIMPLVITTALKSFGSGFAGTSSVIINSIAIGIFAIAYFWGKRIVDVRV